MKKLRNLIVTIGIMTALVPTLLYYAQGAYYGPGFSIITASIACCCFSAAALLQFVDGRKKGKDTKGAALIALGFIVLLIYINFFM